MPINPNDVKDFNMYAEKFVNLPNKLMRQVESFIASVKKSDSEDTYALALAIMKTFDEGLGPLIDKLPNAKPASFVKDATAIQKIVKSYKDKIDDNSYLSEGLSPPLKRMKLALKGLIEGEGVKETHLKELASARSDWKTRKGRADTFLASAVKSMAGDSKETLQKAATAYKTLKTADEKAQKLGQLLNGVVALEAQKFAVIKPKLISSIQDLDTKIADDVRDGRGYDMDDLSLFRKSAKGLVDILNRS